MADSILTTHIREAVEALREREHYERLRVEQKEKWLETFGERGGHAPGIVEGRREALAIGLEVIERTRAAIASFERQLAIAERLEVAEETTVSGRPCIRVRGAGEYSYEATVREDGTVLHECADVSKGPLEGLDTVEAWALCEWAQVVECRKRNAEVD